LLCVGFNIYALRTLIGPLIVLSCHILGKDMLSIWVCLRITQKRKKIKNLETYGQPLDPFRTSYI
jgi:hypothetical protein